MKQKKSSRKRLLAFLPAAVLIGVVAGVAAGISVIPSATAADVTVTGSVAATLDIPATTDPGNTGGIDGATGTAGCTAAGADATLAIASGWESAARLTGGCLINFGSSTGQAELTYANGNVAGPFWCNHPGGGARACGTVNEVADLPVGSNSALAVNTFGIAVSGSPTNAIAGAGFVEDATPTAGESIWRGIPANSSPTQLCATSASTTGSCQFNLGVRGKGAVPTQNNGSYDGILRLVIDQI